MAEVELALSEARPGASVPTDDRRLRQMVGDHFDLVWRTLRRFGVPESDLDDGVQKVFVVASRRLSDIVRQKERSFLFQTAVRVAADERRTRTRRREAPDDTLAHVSHPLPSPEDLIDQHRARLLLDELLEGLPLDLRAVLVLFEMEQMSRTEIAEALDLPPGTVASRLNRARELFDAQLEARKVTTTRGEKP